MTEFCSAIMSANKLCGAPAVFERRDDWPSGKRETSGLCHVHGSEQLCQLRENPHCAHLNKYIVIKPKP